MEIASLYNVSYAYHTKSNETLALQNLNIKIFDNEIVGIIGPSGCGKSTILSLFSGLICPENGKVYTQDKLNENFTGYMLQKDELFPWRNVISNIMIGCEIKKEKDKSYAYELLKKYHDKGYFVIGWTYRDEKNKVALKEIYDNMIIENLNIREF